MTCQQPNHRIDQNVRIERHRQELAEPFGMLVIGRTRQKDDFNARPLEPEHAGERSAVQPATGTAAIAVRLGTREWLNSTLGRDFRLGFEEGMVLSKFPSKEAAWNTYVTGSRR